MNNLIVTYIPNKLKIKAEIEYKRNINEIENIVIEIYLKQDAFKHISASKACSLGLADDVLLKLKNHNLIFSINTTKQKHDQCFIICFFTK